MQDLLYLLFLFLYRGGKDDPPFPPVFARAPVYGMIKFRTGAFCCLAGNVPLHLRPAIQNSEMFRLRLAGRSGESPKGKALARTRRSIGRTCQRRTRFPLAGSFFPPSHPSQPTVSQSADRWAVGCGVTPPAGGMNFVREECGQKKTQPYPAQ